MSRCPICDQKAMNCDCTSKEKEQFEELSEIRDENESLQDALQSAKEEGAQSVLNFLYKSGEIFAIRDVNHLFKVWKEQNGN